MARSPSSTTAWRWLLRLLASLLFCLLVAYIAACAYLYAIQDSQIYPREATHGVLLTAEAIRQAKAVGLVPWDHPTRGASSPQGYVPTDFANATSRGTIVVFHGNGGWAVNRTVYPQAFGPRGFRTFLYEYPGYGGRPGAPHESDIVPDAVALVRSLNRQGYGPIYLWGESLGSGIAAEVAKDPTAPVRGVVLLTPYNRIAGVALYRYPWIPVTLLLRDRYDSEANLAHFHHPICVARSEFDQIIPPPLTLELFQRLPNPKKMILFPGVGHENWPSDPGLAWWDDALNFIAPP